MGNKPLISACEGEGDYNQLENLIPFQIQQGKSDSQITHHLGQRFMNIELDSLPPTITRCILIRYE